MPGSRRSRWIISTDAPAPILVRLQIGEVRGFAPLPHREHAWDVLEEDDPACHDQAAWVIDGGLGSAVACFWAASC